MTIDSIDVVVYTAYFVLPGYIIYGIVNSFVPRKISNDGEKLLRFIFYSLLELALWFWLLKCIDKASDTYWIKLLGAVLLTSFITGVVMGVFLKWNPVGQILRKLKIQIINPIPTAWDYKFSELKQGRRITVALLDDTFIRGKYYRDSMASSESDYKDIYLEEAWQLDDDNNWVRIEGTDGVWVSPNVIKWISFMEDVDNARE